MSKLSLVLCFLTVFSSSVFAFEDTQILTPESLNVKKQTYLAQVSVTALELEKMTAEIDLKTAVEKFELTQSAYMKGYSTSENYTIAKEEVSILQLTSKGLALDVEEVNEMLNDLAADLEDSYLQDGEVLDTDELVRVATKQLVFWKRKQQRLSISIKLAQSERSQFEQVESYQRTLFRKGYLGALGYNSAKRDTEKAELKVKAYKFNLDLVKFAVEELEQVLAQYAPAESEEPTDEVVTDEVKTDEVKTDEVKTDDVKTDDAVPAQTEKKQ